MPGTGTVARRRRPRFAVVMPLARSLTSLRWGSSPNSGQSRSVPAPVAPVLAAGIARTLAVGVEISAGAFDPHAPSRAQAPMVSRTGATLRARIASF